MFPTTQTSLDEARRVFQSCVSRDVWCCQVRRKRLISEAGIVWEVTYRVPDYYSDEDCLNTFNECRLYGGKTLFVYREETLRGMYIAVVYTETHVPIIPSNKEQEDKSEADDDGSKDPEVTPQLVEVSQKAPDRKSRKSRKHWSRKVKKEDSSISQIKSVQRHALKVNLLEAEIVDCYNKKYPINEYESVLKPRHLFIHGRNVTYYISKKSRLSRGLLKTLVEHKKKEEGDHFVATTPKQFVESSYDDPSDQHMITPRFPPQTKAYSRMPYDYSINEHQYQISQIGQHRLFEKALTVYKMTRDHRMPLGIKAREAFLTCSQFGLPKDESGLSKLITAYLLQHGYSPLAATKVLTGR